MLAGAVAAGIATASLAASAHAWDLAYQPPERGLREIYANGEQKIVSRSGRRIDTWCIYNRRGDLLRRTLTLDSFFVIERTRFRPERHDQDSPPSYRAEVSLPDGSIWPLAPGKSIRFIVSVAGSPGKALRVEGRLSVIGRRMVTVGKAALQAVIVRATAKHWYEAYPIGDSMSEYAYFPAYRTSIVLKDLRYNPNRRVPTPVPVRIEKRSNASVRRLIQSDCGPPTA